MVSKTFADCGFDVKCLSEAHLVVSTFPGGNEIHYSPPDGRWYIETSGAKTGLSRPRMQEIRGVGAAVCYLKLGMDSRCVIPRAAVAIAQERARAYPSSANYLQARIIYQEWACKESRATRALLAFSLSESRRRRDLDW